MNYAQNEFSKSQAKARLEKSHSWVNFIAAVVGIAVCVVMAVRCIH